MIKLKKILVRRFSDLAFYFRYLRYRIMIAVLLGVIVGVLDGFGLAMFLPLLQMVSGAETVDGESLGRLQFLIEGMERIGIHFSLFKVLLIMVVFFTLKGVVAYINALYEIKLTELFIKKVRKELLASFGQLRYKFFVQADVGRMQNTLTGEVERVALSFREYFKTIQSAIMVVVYLLFALFIDPRFALLVTLGGGITHLLYRQIYKRVKKRSQRFTHDTHNYQGLVIQFVSNFKYLKATALVTSFAKQLDKSIDDIEYQRNRIRRYGAIMLALREPAMIFIVTAVIYVQVVILYGSMESILLSLLFFYRAMTSLVQLQTFWNRYIEVSGSVDNLKEFSAELRQNIEVPAGAPFEGIRNTIELRKGGFAYGETPILKGIDIKVKKNETIAFVGESGSGKTSLVNILAGLLPLDQGELVADGKNLYEYDLRTYQNKIGYITQDTVIFNDTIFNNVTFWDAPTEENYARFYEALEKASIQEFIAELPEKEQTKLGNNGINLSGGQKQRISIARELYKDIEILIMDEATSALDSETEQVIQQNIDELKGQYTMFIVAHRLSTIRNADRIAMMHRGEIVATGTYEELIACNTSFERMVRLQEL